jgi:hypothetical protein
MRWMSAAKRLRKLNAIVIGEVPPDGGIAFFEFFERIRGSREPTQGHEHGEVLALDQSLQKVALFQRPRFRRSVRSDAGENS